MKTKIFVAAGIVMLSGSAMASESAFNFGDFDMMYLKVMGVLISILVLIILGLTYLMLKAVRNINKPVVAALEERTAVEKLFSLHSLKHEKELMLDESFDGIVELDNPTPPWFNFMFYSTIVFAIIYGFWYHFLGYGQLQKAEYDQQLADAEIAKVEYLKKVGNTIDENNVKLLVDSKQINEGKEMFMTKCAVCHGAAGEGKVGPNLTDEYWLHGGEINNIFKTIKYGVTGKGMIAWEKSLNGLQMAELASYITTLQGTNPPGALAPQGTKMESTKSDSTQTTPAKDSLITALQ